MKLKDFENAFSMLQKRIAELPPEQKKDFNYYTILGDISIEIVNYRRNNQMDQKQLACMLDVSQSMISKYESGEYNFSIKTLNELCSALHLTLNLSITPDAGKQPDSLVPIDIEPFAA